MVFLQSYLLFTIFGYDGKERIYCHHQGTFHVSLLLHKTAKLFSLLYQALCKSTKHIDDMLHTYNSYNRIKKFVLSLTASCSCFMQLYFLIFNFILTYLFFISSDSPPNSLRALITFFKTSVCRHSVWKVCVREIHSEPKLKNTPVFID